MVKKLILLLLPLTLILSYKNVFAVGISSANTGSVVQVIDNLTAEVTHSVSGNQWSNWGTGYLYFDFSLMKVNGTSTSVNVFPRSATATSGGINYICSLGSATSNNSTFNSMLFSAKCPMVMSSDGLTEIRIQFQDFQSNASSEYRFIMGGLKTFEQVSDNSFTVDTSGTTSAINNQITNDNQNTQDIINSQEEQTQDIIDNQNSNTDKQIESQKVCDFYSKDNIKTNGYYLNSNGQETSSSIWGISKYIKLNSSSIVKVKATQSTNGYICFYDNDKGLISCISNSNLSNGSTLTIPTDSSYVRFSINKNTNTPQFEICNSGNQAIVDSQKENTNAINDVNDTLKDDNVDNPSNDISSLSGQVSSTDSISDIFLLPIRLIQIILNSLNSTSCSSINLGSLYGTNLTFTCINLQSILGNTLYNLIDLFFAFGIIFGLRKYILEIFTKITSLKEDNLND